MLPTKAAGLDATWMRDCASTIQKRDTNRNDERSALLDADASLNQVLSPSPVRLTAGPPR